MNFETIIVEKGKGIAEITLNRPKEMNAMNATMQEELVAAIGNIYADDGIKVVVLKGAGRAFCAGGDVKGMGTRGPIEVREMFRKLYEDFLLRITDSEKVLITAINGFAVGAGCNLALLGDIIIASEEATFSEVFVKVGLVPDFGGLYFLPRLVGLPKAKELMFTGDMINAREAERIGLINRVVRGDELEAVVRELAGKLTAGPSKAIGMMKSILNRSLEMDFRSVLEYEAYAQSICMQTEDHKEGLKAFLEKRDPKFVG